MLRITLPPNCFPISPNGSASSTPPSSRHILMITRFPWACKRQPLRLLSAGTVSRNGCNVASTFGGLITIVRRLFACTFCCIHTYTTGSCMCPNRSCLAHLFTQYGDSDVVGTGGFSIPPPQIQPIGGWDVSLTSGNWLGNHSWVCCWLMWVCISPM